MSQQATNEDLEKVIAKTPLGERLLAHYKLILAAVGLILLIVVSVLYYQSARQKTLAAENQKLVQFENEVLKLNSQEEVQLDGKQVLPAFKDFISELRSPELAVVHLAEIYRLGKEHAMEEELAEIYDSLIARLPRNNFSFYLATLHYSVLLEDSGELEQAQKVLRALINHPFKVADHLYFQLGRLAFQSGDRQEAMKHLEYLQKEFPASEFTRQAKALLKLKE